MNGDHAVGMQWGLAYKDALGRLIGFEMAARRSRIGG